MKQKLPKWFDGSLYDNGDTVTNPYSGEKIELTAEELSMYDFCMGATMICELAEFNVNEKILRDLRKGLDWFRVNNPKAYMVLLD